jgi:hypothetical protein
VRRAAHLRILPILPQHGTAHLERLAHAPRLLYFLNAYTDDGEFQVSRLPRNVLTGAGPPSTTRREPRVGGTGDSGPRTEAGDTVAQAGNRPQAARPPPTDAPEGPQATSGRHPRPTLALAEPQAPAELETQAEQILPIDAPQGPQAASGRHPGPVPTPVELRAAAQLRVPPRTWWFASQPTQSWAFCPFLSLVADRPEALWPAGAQEVLQLFWPPELESIEGAAARMRELWQDVEMLQIVQMHSVLPAHIDAQEQELILGMDVLAVLEAGPPPWRAAPWHRLVDVQMAQHQELVQELQELRLRTLDTAIVRLREWARANPLPRAGL